MQTNRFQWSVMACPNRNQEDILHWDWMHMYWIRKAFCYVYANHSLMLSYSYIADKTFSSVIFHMYHSMMEHRHKSSSNPLACVLARVGPCATSWRPDFVVQLRVGKKLAWKIATWLGTREVLSWIHHRQDSTCVFMHVFEHLCLHMFMHVFEYFYIVCINIQPSKCSVRWLIIYEHIINEYTHSRFVRKCLLYYIICNI